MHDNAVKALADDQRPRIPHVILPTPAFYNVAETAEIMRLDQSTMYRHLRSGRFPGVKIGGRYVVPHVVLERLIDDVLAVGRCLDIADWTVRWRADQFRSSSGGAA